MIVDLADINVALVDRLESWLPGLIGGQYDRTRKVWKAEAKRHGGMGDSLEVTMSGSHAGWFCHYAAGNKVGDALGLINYVKFGDADMKAAFAYARDVILQGHVVELTKEERERIATRRKQEEAEAARKREWREKLAASIFLNECRDLLGTPVEKYFRDERSLDLRRLPYPIRALRYHPALEHPQLKRKLPAMVAAVVHGDNKIRGIHRVWLVERRGQWDRVRGDGFEGFDKDGVEVDGKLSLGTVLGGAIRLWPGLRESEATPGRWVKGYSWAKAPAGSLITIAEAIEEGVTLAVAAPKRRVACGTAVNCFRFMALPEQFSQVVLAGNRDAEGSEADVELKAGLEARLAEGRAASIAQPPGAKDWNAWWKALVGERRSA